jgi:hypothetical protein
MWKLFALVAVLILVTGFSSATDDKEEIEALLAQFQAGIAEKSFEKLLDVFINEQAAVYSVANDYYDGAFDSGKNSAVATARNLSGSTVPMKELLIDPEIVIHGRVASVTCKYEFYRDSMMTNYGTDIFSLVKTANGWKIAAVIWTVTLTDEWIALQKAPLK